MNADKVDMVRVMTKVEAVARKLGENAGYSGAIHDGGSGVIEATVKYYRYGMLGEVPPEWQPYAAEVIAEADPEYATYQRLKAKFGAK